MENYPTLPEGARLTPGQLATLLREAADEVERDASFEGSINWETPREAGPRKLEVLAYVHTGEGQGAPIVVNQGHQPLFDRRNG